mmetsp:Transcript_11959/g.22978  ORF Transcript_11959/g.22978 Transcript_11959/m.22978 type:complete len:579 (-) Transcript_11959:84-1820(-)|eukprot:scaffold2997_cov182-Amphora_coffeaeformis.AAC.4
MTVNNHNEEEHMMFDGFDGDSLFMAAVGRESSEELPAQESFQDEPSLGKKKSSRNKARRSSNLEDFIPRRTIAGTATGAGDTSDDRSQTSGSSSNFSETKLGKLLTTRRGLNALKKSKLEKVAQRISSRRILTKKSKQDTDSTEGSESTTHDFLEDPEHGGTGTSLFDDGDDLYMEAMGVSNSGSRSNYFAVTKELLRVPEQETTPPRPSIVSKIRDTQKNQGVSWPYYDNIMPGEEADSMRHNNARSRYNLDKVMTMSRSRQWWMALVVVLCVVITMPLVLKHKEPKPQYNNEFPLITDIADLNRILEDPSLYHDWSDAKIRGYPDQSYFLHPVNETYSEIAIKAPRGGNVTIFRLSTQKSKDVLVNSILNDLYGHHHKWCSETWPDATPQHVAEGTMVIVPTEMKDTQILACIDGRLAAFAIHLYVPSWNGIQQPHELRVMDFYNTSHPPAIHSEPTDIETQLYILLISSQRYPIFMYVQEQDAVESLNKTFNKHPDDVHPCHSDNTANDPAGTIRHPTKTVDSMNSQIILWDVSQIRAEQKQPTWSSLVWDCDMGGNKILKPIGQLSVVNVKDKK